MVAGKIFLKGFNLNAYRGLYLQPVVYGYVPYGKGQSMKNHTDFSANQG